MSTTKSAGKRKRKDDASEDIDPEPSNSEPFAGDQETENIEESAAEQPQKKRKGTMRADVGELEPVAAAPSSIAVSEAVAQASEGMETTPQTEHLGDKDDSMVAQSSAASGTYQSTMSTEAESKKKRKAAEAMERQLIPIERHHVLPFPVHDVTVVPLRYQKVVQWKDKGGLSFESCAQLWAAFGFTDVTSRKPDPHGPVTWQNIQKHYKEKEKAYYELTGEKRPPDNEEKRRIRLEKLKKRKKTGSRAKGANAGNSREEQSEEEQADGDDQESLSEAEEERGARLNELREKLYPGYLPHSATSDDELRFKNNSYGPTIKFLFASSDDGSAPQKSVLLSLRAATKYSMTLKREIDENLGSCSREAPPDTSQILLERYVQTISPDPRDDLPTHDMAEDPGDRTAVLAKPIDWTTEALAQLYDLAYRLESQNVQDLVHDRILADLRSGAGPTHWQGDSISELTSMALLSENPALMDMAQDHIQANLLAGIEMEFTATSINDLVKKDGEVAVRFWTDVLAGSVTGGADYHLSEGGSSWCEEIRQGLERKKLVRQPTAFFSNNVTRNDRCLTYHRHDPEKGEDCWRNLGTAPQYPFNEKHNIRSAFQSGKKFDRCLKVFIVYSS